ncbi:MAG: peptide chain release factor N(5)-glutamine methyltransferase [Candidatus Omnitrophica bacterium]|nr:peptide chain release factor N(5)-glutamine methyltransferase [Candidatus Omnitrophota bacterium]
MTEDEQILTTVLNCRRVDLYADPKPLTRIQQKQYLHMKSRLASGEPLQYILGFSDFMGIKLFVDERVLIPRPETEILVEVAIEKAQALKSQRPLRILDLGTGSGNVAIALAKNIPDALISTVDISYEAIELAEANARANGVHEQVRFILRDMVNFLKEQQEANCKFDLIISNPPYIPTFEIPRLPADVLKEPRMALDGGDDGLDFYREIIALSVDLLDKGSFLLLEIGDGQAEKIHAMVKASEMYDQCVFQKDYVGTDRIAVMTR